MTDMTGPSDASDPPDLHATRVAYDTVADDYAELLRDALAGSPFDRAMLAVFAELVQVGGVAGTGGGRPVADLGCGPGRVTAHLHELGLSVFGVDLSPAMIAVARRTYPHLRFAEGSITALDRLDGPDLTDGSLAGIVAWYSIIHTPPDQLSAVLAGFHRVLAPGGQLLLAFQVGDERVHIEHAYGHAVAIDAYRLSPDRVADLLGEASLPVHARLVREPQPPEKVPQAYLMARKPSL